MNISYSFQILQDSHNRCDKQLLIERQRQIAILEASVERLKKELVAQIQISQGYKRLLQEKNNEVKNLSLQLLKLSAQLFNFQKNQKKIFEAQIEKREQKKGDNSIQNRKNIKEWMKQKLQTLQQLSTLNHKLQKQNRGLKRQIQRNSQQMNDLKEYSQKLCIESEAQLNQLKEELKTKENLIDIIKDQYQKFKKRNFNEEISQIMFRYCEKKKQQSSEKGNQELKALIDEIIKFFVNKMGTITPK